LQGRLSFFLGSDTLRGCGGGGWAFFFEKDYFLQKNIGSFSEVQCNCSCTQKVQLCTIFRGFKDRHLRGGLSISRDKRLFLIYFGNATMFP
jgi:hypothetical protein